MMEDDYHPYYLEGRRQLDQDRLYEEGVGVDAALEGRKGSRPSRAACELASRRRASDHVREGFPEQPRLDHWSAL
jgi:hypothetical protein